MPLDMHERFIYCRTMQRRRNHAMTSALPYHKGIGSSASHADVSVPVEAFEYLLQDIQALTVRVAADVALSRTILDEDAFAQVMNGTIADAADGLDEMLA